MPRPFSHFLHVAFSPDGLTGWVPAVLFLLVFLLLRQVQPLGFPWEGQGLVAIVVGTGLGLAALAGGVRNERRFWRAGAQILAFGSGLLMLWYLRCAEYAPGGFWVDNWFSNAMIMHYKADAGNHDFTYRELHGFYPALFHWVCARLAVIFAVPAHKMLPLAAIWTAYLLPLLSFRIWRSLLDGRSAFLITAAVIYLSMEMLPGKSYEMIALILVLPWYLHYQHRLGPENGFLSRRVVIGGIAGGLLAMTYYYWFFLFALVFVGEFALGTRKNGGQVTRSAFRPRWYVLFWLLVSSIPFWAPLLYDLGSHPVESFQNRWFRPWMTGSSLFQHRPWMIYAGVAYLLFAAARGWLPRFLLGMLTALLAWNLLGMLFMTLGMPLLHARMNLFFDWAAMLGLALGVVHLGEWALERWKTPIQWLFSGLAVLLLFHTAQNMLISQSGEAYELAHSSHPPAVVTDPELVAFAPGKVFLTNKFEINAHLPVYLFVGHTAYYSHPASEYRERLAMLEALSHTRNPDFAAWLLTYNRWTPVEGVYWEDQTMIFGMDNFPHEQATRQVPVSLSQELFRGSYFVPGGIGNWYKVEKPPYELLEQFSESQIAVAERFGKSE